MIEIIKFLRGFFKPSVLFIIFPTRALLLLETFFLESCISQKSCFLFYFPNDSKNYRTIARKNLSKLEQVGLDVKRILADADFSSGENYVMLEEMGIEAFITLHGTYESHRAGFKYDGRRHAFRCQNGRIFLIRL